MKPSQSVAIGYAVAVAVTLLTFATSYTLPDFLGDKLPFMPFVLTVVVAAWYGGLGPGLLATALGAVLAWYFFVTPPEPLQLVQPSGATRLVLFAVFGATTSWLLEVLHAARRRVEAERDAGRRTEEALRAVSDELRVVTETVSAPIARCSRDLRYLWVNKHYAALLGRRPEDVGGRTIVEVLGRDTFETLHRYYERVLSGETVRFEEAVDYPGRGGQRWISKIYTPTFDSDGTPDGWVAAVIDIDERKRAEVALKEADRRKDEFLAVLSHELRDPLASIANALEALRLGAGDGRASEKSRSIMERQVRQVSRLVDDLLDLNRIVHGTLELRKKRLELIEVVRQAVETSQPALDAAAHELMLSLPHESVYVDGDPARLAQVFSNLLNNAAKYTARGGRISIAAERQGGEVVVRIRDTGIGIPEEMLSRVFDMFARVDSSVESSRTGLGIGLTVVKRLVEMHGGKVEARSDGTGLGSEFVVRLPAAAERSVGPAVSV